MTMTRVKILYRFMLRSFLPLFLMTFVICLFIVLMQFLWKYIDDLVGKGLSVEVIGELFFYAALTMVPMALPLSILLASLMTFGNLGERLELTALKASGISLFKIMSPLIILISAVGIGAFFFQNDVLPVAQAKMYTLLFSMRQKSPEVEIPERSFYDQIPGLNIFVESKNQETGMLYDMMLYDVSRGFDNTRVILADSGRLSFTQDQTHLFLRLHEGEQFENLRDQTVRTSSKNMPYRKESFTDKEILVAFDANFNRIDESGMRNQYIGKNMAELRATMDSVSLMVDSLGDNYGKAIKENPYFGIPHNKHVYKDHEFVDVPQPEVEMAAPLDVDSLFHGSSTSYAKTYLTQALNKAKRQKQEYEFKSLSMADQRRTIRRHDIELQKKFTLSFACIIFFFIGAPLGAIIKKGGIGAPLVISVILFIIYYIIDNTGFKMAREGHVQVWMGMWISSVILLALGIFLTHKAINDSAVLNIDAYLNLFKRLTGHDRTRHIEMKEITMEEVDREKALGMMTALNGRCQKAIAPGRQGYLDYWLKGFDSAGVTGISSAVEELIEHLSNSRDILVIGKLSQYPLIGDNLLYHPAAGRKWAAWGFICVFPLGIALYLIGRKLQKNLIEELERVLKLDGEIAAMLSNEDKSN